jgi:hypothetical protein
MDKSRTPKMTIYSAVEMISGIQIGRKTSILNKQYENKLYISTLPNITIVDFL